MLKTGPEAKRARGSFVGEDTDTSCAMDIDETSKEVDAGAETALQTELTAASKLLRSFNSIKHDDVEKAVKFLQSLIESDRFPESVPNIDDQEVKAKKGAEHRTDKEDEVPVEPDVFLSHVVDRAKTRGLYEELVIVVCLHDVGTPSLKDRSLLGPGEDKMRAEIQALGALPHDRYVRSIQVTRPGEGGKFVMEVFERPWYCSQVDAFFGLRRGDLSALRTFLDSRLHPIAETRAGGILTPDLKYVGVSNSSPYTKDIQPDKAYAIVIGGESGSGKSVHACLGALEEGFLPVYVVMNIEKDTKPQSEFPHLHNLLRRAICYYDDNDEDQTKSLAVISIKSRLNTNRNVWAQRMLEDALKGLVIGNDNAMLWLEGQWDEGRLPEKVAIIADEATDIDLAEGLVASVRVLRQRYLERLAKKDVQIVVAGTGLEAIRYKGRVGTNPAYSRLVLMRQPCLEELKAIASSQQVRYDAIRSGLFSRVMSTNARMLFRSVIPILSLDVHKVDGRDLPDLQARLFERLTAVASFGPLMDHGPRFYVNQNTIGKLDSKIRQGLLKQAFCYHLATAIKNSSAESSSEKEMDSNAACLEEIIKLQLEEVETVCRLSDLEKEEENIFSKGLATRHETSPALKYLATFGLSCKVRSGFGDEFEELAALHYVRYMEVQGYAPCIRVTLQHGWPPKSNKGDEKIGNAEISSLKTTLESQFATELEDWTAPDTDNFCVVFSQGTATAQGGDILILTGAKGKYELETVQCKHYKSSPGPKIIREWWSSLGIDLKASNEATFEPNVGKAGYSYVGVMKFCELLSNRMGGDVKLGKRTLCVSFKRPKSGCFPVPKGCSQARVWFHEMLEPTISTFALRDAPE